jgi:hypothetical protein
VIQLRLMEPRSVVDAEAQSAEDVGETLLV